MKRIFNILFILVVFFLASNCSFAWVNEDISDSFNIMEKFSTPVVKTYMDSVLSQLKSEFYDNNTEKDWISEINFRIDKHGNVYSKNYVLKDGKIYQPRVEDAMMRFDKVSAPPQEYNQELIFVTFEHKNKKTSIYFSKI